MSEPRVLYEDNHLLVLEKPACLPCVPDSSEDRSLLDWGRLWGREKYGKPGAVFLGVGQRPEPSTYHGGEPHKFPRFRRGDPRNHQF